MIAVHTSINFAVPCIAVNQLDLAPHHAGKITGLTFTIGNLASIATPHAVSVFTSYRSTRSGWQNVFFLAAGVQIVGAIIFVIFGSGNRQHWADHPTAIELSAALDPNKQHVNEEEVTDFAEQ